MQHNFAVGGHSRRGARGNWCVKLELWEAFRSNGVMVRTRGNIGRVKFQTAGMWEEKKLVSLRAKDDDLGRWVATRR